MQGEGFLPWIGERFAQQPQRLLLLGESHYVGERTGPNLTRELTREYRDGVWRHRYWTGLMQVVKGQPAAEIDRVAFWNRVAFYNYVQTALDDSGIAPSREAFRASDDTFFRVLDELRPNAMAAIRQQPIPGSGSTTAGCTDRPRRTAGPGRFARGSHTPHGFIGGIGHHGLRACASWRSSMLWVRVRWRMFRHGLNLDPPTKQRNLTRCATGSR